MKKNCAFLSKNSSIRNYLRFEQNYKNQKKNHLKKLCETKKQLIIKINWVWPIYQLRAVELCNNEFDAHARTATNSATQASAVFARLVHVQLPIAGEPHGGHPQLQQDSREAGHCRQTNPTSHAPQVLVVVRQIGPQWVSQHWRQARSRRERQGADRL